MLNLSIDTSKQIIIVILLDEIINYQTEWD